VEREARRLADEVDPERGNVEGFHFRRLWALGFGLWEERRRRRRRDDHQE
jgi:hypothetical protein